jgi:hypothetical protein
MTNIDIPQPDPDWEYYEPYLLLHQAKDRIEKLIEYLAAREKASQASEIHLHEEIHELVRCLENCVE